MKVKRFNFNLKGIVTDSRRRTIAITVVASVLLLGGIIGAILSATTRPSKQLAGEDSTTGISSPIDDIASAAGDTLDPVDNSASAGTATVTETPSVPVTGEAENLPKTGPEDILPLIALVLAATAYFATKKQKMAAPVGIEPTL